MYDGWKVCASEKTTGAAAYLAKLLYKPGIKQFI